VNGCVVCAGVYTGALGAHITHHCHARTVPVCVLQIAVVVVGGGGGGQHECLRTRNVHVALVCWIVHKSSKPLQTLDCNAECKWISSGTVVLLNAVQGMQRCRETVCQHSIVVSGQRARFVKERKTQAEETNDVHVCMTAQSSAKRDK
jgi:hypothetical protein